MNAGEVDEAKFKEAADKGVYVCPDTVIVTPWKDGRGDVRVFRSWQAMATPMNSKVFPIDVLGMEVGEAYNELFRMAIEDPRWAAWPWILTIESDNIVPYEALPRLLKAISACPDCSAPIKPDEFHCRSGHRGYDAVGGIYFTKTRVMPTAMAFGDPANGPSDFAPRDTRGALESNGIIEVNGVAMGCTLFRKASIKAMRAPWFETSDRATQDLAFCKRAKADINARFAVDCGVKVGHMEFSTGEIF